MSVNTTPRTWVVGEIVTAAEMNTEVRDFATGIQAARTSYTPALTSTGTNPTLGTGSSVTGSYQRYGKEISGTAEIVFGSAGFAAGTGTYRVSLPVASVANASINGRVMGEGTFFDSSTSNFYNVILVASTTTTCTMTINAAGAVSATTPVVPALSDQIRYKFNYEAA